MSLYFSYLSIVISAVDFFGVQALTMVVVCAGDVILLVVASAKDKNTFRCLTKL